MILARAGSVPDTRNVSEQNKKFCSYGAYILLGEIEKTSTTNPNEYFLGQVKNSKSG